jgi:hypothetical protein
MSSSWRTRCGGSASCRRPSARRANACWRMQQMHRAANERRRRLKMFSVSGQGGQQARARPAPTCRAPAVAMQSVSHQREAAERQARPALLVTGRVRIPSGAGAGAAATAERGHGSPPSWNPPAGSRTRCGGSLPAWCARSSGSSLPPRRPTAAEPIGLLAVASQEPSSVTPPWPSRAPDHMAALARALQSAQVRRGLACVMVSVAS